MDIVISLVFGIRLTGHTADVSIRLSVWIIKLSIGKISPYHGRFRDDCSASGPHRRKLDPGRQLAITAALEHVTATLAQWTLENPEAGMGRDNQSPLREMLIWHAMEEIEHKAVAFDVYRATVNNEKQRIMVAKFIFRMFWVQNAIAQLILLWRDRKIPSLKHISEAWNFMWGNNGFRRWSAPEFQRYLEPGFHPNDINQSHLIEQWQENYPEVAALQIG